MSPSGQDDSDDASRKISVPEAKVLVSVYLSVRHRMKLYRDELDGVASELHLETCPIEERLKYLDKLRYLSLVHPERFANDYFLSYSGLPKSWMAIGVVAALIPASIQAALKRLEGLAGASYLQHVTEFRTTSLELDKLAVRLEMALDGN